MFHIVEIVKYSVLMELESTDQITYGQMQSAKLSSWAS